MLLGIFPEMSAAEAREKADDARHLLHKGIDPMGERKKQKQLDKICKCNSFKSIAEEWLTNVRKDRAESTQKRDRASLEKDVYPYIGNQLIDSIVPSNIVNIIRQVEKRVKGDTPLRIKNRCNMIFMYAIATGRCSSNPTQCINDAIRQPEYKHFAAITDMRRFSEFLRAIDDYKSFSQVSLKNISIIGC